MRKDRKKIGFTLLELLTVMAIMALLSTFAVTSYFGAIRGMTRRSAIKHFANTLVLAKQRATMEGAGISVLIYNEMTGIQNDEKQIVPSYVIVRELGRVTKVSEKTIYDEFTDLASYFDTQSEKEDSNEDDDYSSIRLYNIDQASWKEVYPKAFKLSTELKYLASSGNDLIPSSRSLNIYGLKEHKKVPQGTASDVLWKVGDRYGIEVSSPNSLPKNFYFQQIADDSEGRKSMSITFSPNGKVDCKGCVTDIKIEERLGENHSNWKSANITIESTGEITYDEKWR